MKLIRKKHHRAMHLKAQAIKEEVRRPFDWQTEWRRKREDRNLPPAERFAGEPWYERNKDGILRWPVGR